MAVATATRPEPTEMLALPSGAEPAPPRRQQVTVGVLVAVVAGAMLFGGLIAAYLVLRSTTGRWPPRGVRFDNYTATTLAVTLLMASITIEWAVSAVRNGQRGQALAGLGLTLGLGLAFLNAAWFLISKFNFRPAQHPYGTVAYALAVLGALNGLVGVGFVLLTGLRVVGHQVGEANRHLMRATALYWHFVTAAWAAVFYTLYVSK